MSEFQYYEFQAIDRPLNANELAAVKDMSSRVEATSRRAVFTYSYSNFRYDEVAVLIKYFDFMFYLANWGTKRILMKFPEALVDYDFLKRYDMSVNADYIQELNVFKKSGFVIIDIHLTESDGYGWIDDYQDISFFVDMREEILNGDYQSLFMAWLRFLKDYCIQIEENLADEDFDGNFDMAEEGFKADLIPTNLARLNRSSQAIKEFYEIDEYWLNAVKQFASDEEENKIDFEKQLTQMPQERMLHYLKLIIKGEPHLKNLLIKELSEGSTKKKPAAWIMLQDVANIALKANQMKLKQEQERAKKEELQRMNNMKNNKNKIQQEIYSLIAKSNRASYDLALKKIIDFKEMCDYFNMQADFEQMIDFIKKQYSRKSSFMYMLELNKY